MKLGFLMLVVVALAFALGNSALALHKAATLKCMSCHTIHASENGSAAGVNPGNGFDAAPSGGMSGPNEHLLLQSNVTDLCLVCHSQSSVFTEGGNHAPAVYSTAGSPTVSLPGGDYWSSAQADGTTPTVGARGHNPGRQQYGTGTGNYTTLLPEDENITNPLLPPGSSTGAITRWDCVACHAPHYGDNDGTDSYGASSSFRMLWGKPAGKGSSDVVLNATGGNLASSESNANHTAYKGNVSQWCAQCHGNFHNTTSLLIHPSGDTLGTVAGNYNTNTGYHFIVPVEDTGATTSAVTVSSTSIVMCLSCHRAHAASTAAVGGAPYGGSGEDALLNNTKNMTRWDNEQPSGENRGCNKCHDKGD
jgi:hypothetical protein